MGNCFVSICTDLTVVIQTVYPDDVTLAHDNMFNTVVVGPFFSG